MDASERETNLLKPVTGIMKNNEFTFKKCRFKCVAGGFAAHVDERTFTYNDIDMFKTPFSTTMRFRSEYPNSNIVKIENETPYQFIYVNYDTKTIQEFMEKCLSTFDLQECCVAYGFQVEPIPKFVKCIRQVEYTKNDICKLDVKRMKKYSKRSKKVTSLKWLSLIVVKDNIKESELRDFLNPIEIIF